MKKHLQKTGTLYLLLMSTVSGYSQNIGINQTGATPHASSVLDLNTGNTFTSPNGKGIMPPNVALTSITDAVTVTSPATSLLVYNTATAGTGTAAVVPGYYYWNGTQWVANTGNDWKTTGNAATTAGTNFIGTTDGVDFVTKTNNTERMRVTSGGNVGIGTTAPTSSLHIVATATNTGFQLQDGTEGAGKVLTSDANGKASWVSGQTVSFITSVPSAGLTIPSCVWTNTGEWINLPKAGYYIVLVNLQTSIAGTATGGYAELQLANASGTLGGITGANYITGAPSGNFVKIGGMFLVQVTNPGTFWVMFANCPNPSTTTNWTSISHVSAMFYSN